MAKKSKIQEPIFFGGMETITDGDGVVHILTYVPRRGPGVEVACKTKIVEQSDNKTSECEKCKKKLKINKE